MIEAEQFAAKHLGALLDETCQFEIVGTATHGETAMRLCRELRPEAVFLDINLPGKDGVSLANQLRTLPPAASPRLYYLRPRSSARCLSLRSRRLSLKTVRPNPRARSS